MDKQLASELMKLCLLSYGTSEEYKQALPNLVDVRFYDIDSTDTQFYWVETEEYYALVFRGTQVTHNLSLRDILTNLKVRSIPLRHPGQGENESVFGRVHGGYWEACESALPKTIMLVTAAKAKYPDKPIYITGHSLGGVLATLTAAILVEVDGVYTFGAPRCGNRKFVHYMIQTGVHFYRIARNLDIARSFAPYIFGYRPVKKLYTLHENGELVKGESWNPFNKIPIPIGIGTKRHSPEGYDKLLKKLL